jgi:hypothetical protein
MAHQCLTNIIHHPCARQKWFVNLLVNNLSMKLYPFIEEVKEKENEYRKIDLDSHEIYEFICQQNVFNSAV